MKWKKESFNLGNGKKKNGSSKNKSSSPGPSSSSKRNSSAQKTTTPTTNRSGLGTVRVGIVRGESAPICTPTPRAKRQLISDLLGPDDSKDKGNDGGPVDASPALRGIISNKCSSGKIFDKEVGKGDSFSSYTPEEKVAFAYHLNQHLLGDPFLRHLLPLNPQGDDLFDKFGDGLLLCRLVCLAIPGSVADSKINVPVEGEALGLYKSTENLNVALTAAEAGGLQVINIGASDIMEGRPSSILGLSWQLIRMHLLSQINLKRCPDLIHLMEEGESQEDFYKLPVEEILLRWFNHHLRWGESERRVSNFSEDLVDGKCYVDLIKELNDHFNFDESHWPDEDAKRTQFRRARLVISGAEDIGLAPLIRPRHINGRAIQYNIAFVAQLLNRRPRIHREKFHFKASVALQSWFRMVNVKRRTTPIIEERRAAANALSRACRRWILERRRERAALKLQAYWRGGKGRAEASRVRFEAVKARADAAARAAELERKRIAKEREEEAKREREREIEIARLEREEKARQEKEREEMARKEKEREVEIAKLEREMAALREEQRQATALKVAVLEGEAATMLQAWARGIGTRQAVIAAQEQRRAVVEGEAATVLQAWARGIETRQAVTAALMNREMDLSDLPEEEHQRRESCGSTNSNSLITKYSQAELHHNTSPRTSISSSARFSEIPEGSPFHDIHAGASPKGDGDGGKLSGGWFDKVFQGMSFGDNKREKKDPSRRQQAAAAMIIQRRRRQTLGRRSEVKKAKDEVTKRMSAVRALHKAYATRWRPNIKAKKEMREKMREEEARRESGGGASSTASAKASATPSKGLFGIWSEIIRGLSRRQSASSDDGEERSARLRWFGTGTRGSWKTQQEKAKEDGDCCDAIGQHHLAVDIQASTLSQLILGPVGLGSATGPVGSDGKKQQQQGQAQEKRARNLAEIGFDDYAWTSPEHALSTGKCVAMLSVLITVVYEAALSNAAALGV